MKVNRLLMHNRKEMPEEDNLQRVEFLEKQDMNLLKLKKVLTRSISLMDKLFKISKILEEKIMMENSFKIHKRNHEEEFQRIENQRLLLRI